MRRYWIPPGITYLVSIKQTLQLRKTISKGTDGRPLKKQVVIGQDVIAQLHKDKLIIWDNITVRITVFTHKLLRVFIFGLESTTTGCKLNFRKASEMLQLFSNPI